MTRPTSFFFFAQKNQMWGISEWTREFRSVPEDKCMLCECQERTGQRKCDGTANGGKFKVFL